MGKFAIFYLLSQVFISSSSFANPPDVDASAGPSHEASLAWIIDAFRSGAVLKLKAEELHRGTGLKVTRARSDTIGDGERCALKIYLEDNDRLFRINFTKLHPSSVRSESSFVYVASPAVQYFRNDWRSAGSFRFQISSADIAPRLVAAFRRLSEICNKNLMDDTF